HHKSIFINRMWDIGVAIKEHQYIEIKYQGIQGSTVKTRKLKPLAIMFSEYYFYLTAFIDDEKVHENFRVLDDAFPTIYRIDRIQGLRILDEKYQLPYSDRFEEGEFRKRIQFMYGGKLRRVRFEYSGFSVESVLDRIPTAVILDENEGKYTISAEVFGDGIDMWFRSQGDKIRVL
ncbi:MAG: WYL domain-containing protein, partial [Bacillota bacterium]|nr:WYL domain-containing protein [Bacillota bacterium]